MIMRKLKNELNKKDLDLLIKLYCEYFNVNHACLDIMCLVEEEKLKEYIVNQFVFNWRSFTKEELEEIENREC